MLFIYYFLTIFLDQDIFFDTNYFFYFCPNLFFDKSLINAKLIIPSIFFFKKKKTISIHFCFFLPLDQNVFQIIHFILLKYMWSWRNIVVWIDLKTIFLRLNQNIDNYLKKKM